VTSTGSQFAPYASTDDRRIVWAPHGGLCAVTDVGLGRRRNEDRFLILSDERVFAVADGIGGAPAGEEAGRLAVDLAVDAFLRGCATSEMPRRLASAVIDANQGLLQVGNSRSGWRGMGAALMLACVSGGRVYTAHAGDVRCYVCSGGRCFPITRDHSPVADLLAAGLLTEDETRRHPQRHLISRSVGTVGLQPDLNEHALSSGNRILICTDGVWAVLRHDELAMIAAWPASMRQLATKLIDRAAAAGGNDNATVVVYEHS
jgi:protein phosphatase